MNTRDDAWVVRVPKPRRRVVIAAVLIVVLLALGTNAVVNGTKRVSLDGISFDIPFGWTVRTDMPMTTGFGQPLAIIGTKPWGPCASYDANCHFQEQLSAQQIQVVVNLDTLIGSDFCTYARDRPDLAPRTDGVRVSETHYFRVDGRPAIVTMYSFDTSQYFGSDGWRTWKVAKPDTVAQVYEFSASWRKPGEADFLTALDHLVASIKFVRPTTNSYPPPADCGDPFPAAT